MHTRVWSVIFSVSVCFLLSACDDRAGIARESGSLSCARPCAKGGACTFAFDVPYQAEQSVLASTKSLIIGEGAEITSRNRTPGAIGNVGKLETIAAENAHTGGIFSEAGVALAKGVVVTGPVKTGGNLLDPNGAVVTGPITTHTTIAGDRHVLATVSFAPSATAVQVSGNATRSLTPGDYGAVDVGNGTLALAPGVYRFHSLRVSAAGTLDIDESRGDVAVFVETRFEFAGKQVQHGGDARLLIAVFGCEPVILSAPFRGTVSAQHARLELMVRDGATFAGRYYAEAIRVGAHVRVEGLPAALPPKSSTVASGGHSVRLPPALPAPPEPVPGCYVNTRNGWKKTECASEAFIQAHFPHPDTQVTLTSSATPTLVFGQVDATVPQVGSEANGFVASTSTFPGCQSSGTAIANQWSVQNNTNGWTIPASAGSNVGDTAATQFVIQSDGTTSAICIWNVDVSTQNYPHTCVVPSPQQRAGGLQAFDEGNLAGRINSNGTLSLVAQLSWVPPGKPNTYAVVATDSFDLADNWTEVSGGLLGLGNCSQAQFTNAEVITEVAASTCKSDTDATSPTCAPPTFQPNANVYVGGNGTLETNNLTAVGVPTVVFPNDDLAVTTLTGTTSGNCLGPSHAYIKDNVLDFGATPSTLGAQVFWESPDIFIVPTGTPVDVNGTSTESIVTPGANFDMYIRVHNDLGCSDVHDAKALVYLADPAALSVQWTPVTNHQYVGNNGSATGVTVPAGGAALIGPLTFTAPSGGLGDGHKCAIAAIEANGEPAPANNFDAPDSNQVGQRNLEFVGPCEYPLTNATASSGNLQLTVSISPNTGTQPSLTALPNVQVRFDDSDSSWFNVWKNQTGAGTAFSVKHSASSTTVRLGTYSVALDPVPLAAGQSRNASGSTQLPSGDGTVTLQIAATLTDSGGNVLVTNGGSCSASAPRIR